jgi:HEAT repeat protein
MTSESDKPGGPPKPATPRRPTTAPADAELPSFEERRLKFSELAAVAKQLVFDDLVGMLRDGRAIVRANAALGLAAAGHAPQHLVALLRDSDTRVATAAAEAISRLGPTARELIPQITQALEGTQPAVTKHILGTFAELVGRTDDELIAALDCNLDLAEKTIVEACGMAGKTGIAFLIKAARSGERSRIRINAIAGLGRLGKTDAETAMAFLTPLEANDPVPDVRIAAKKAMLQIVARTKQEVVDALPKNIPDFEARKLAASELAEYAEAIVVDEMIYALGDGRDHVRINAARALAVKGAHAKPAVRPMGLLLRDSAMQVRREVAKSLAKIGAEAIDAADDLVGALGDMEDDVAEAAAEALAPLGDRAKDALIRGLETGGEAHGRRVAELIGLLRDASEVLTTAFTSPAVNVQVNAALGLGMLGRDRIGAGLQSLLGARTGGDPRTREAVRRAIDLLGPKADAGPKPVAVDGFETRVLTAKDFESHKPELDRVGAGDFTMYLQDGREVVRANAATALGVIGAAAVGAARSLGVALRDDSPQVRLATAQALDKIGDVAVVETAGDLVGALGDSDAKVADACAAILRARKARMIGALVRGLETDSASHGRRIVEVINVLPDASEILCDAFESPAVNVQVNAALGLGLLGPAKVGKGRKALEGARTGGWERTREAVRKALELLDGPRSSGPRAVDIDGFETRVLAADAFGDVAQLRIDDLVAYVQDGRAVVRANAATAIGALGPAAKDAARSLGVLLRDDDMRVRISAARAIDRLGDDAVRDVADYIVGALRGDAEVAKTCAQVLATRKARVLAALVRGLETDDDTHARRILELINALPDACEILTDAFGSPAENVQVNAAIGIGMLGTKRAGTAGRKLLEGSRTRGFTRTREAVFKALAMLDATP